MKELLDRIFLLPVRVRVRWRNRHRLRAWEVALGAIRRCYEQSCELGLANLREIYNVGLYVLLIEHDLASLSDDMVYATNDWRRKFVARQMAALLYEGVEDLPSLLGGRFRQRLDAIGLDPSVLHELNGIMKQFGAFKRQHAPELEELRNFVGAHRDHDGGAQLRLLDELKPMKLFELQAQFYVPFRQLVAWLTRLTMATGSLEVVCQQFVRKGQPSNNQMQRTSVAQATDARR